MRVWLVTIGEPLPTDEGNERLLRAGILAEMLIDRGHQVTWWTSAFNHSLKALRVASERPVAVRPGYEIRMLNGRGYRRNISLRRLLDHRRLATEFARQARSLNQPDIIICSFPPIELGLAVMEYGRAANVPAVLDIRDLWPDIFADAAPRMLRPLVNVLVGAMNRAVDRACANATAIWGHAPAFVDWGLRHAHRTPTPWDRVFPFGYVGTEPSPPEVEAAYRFWQSHGITRDEKTLVACFVGAVGHQTDVAGLITTVEHLRSDAGVRIVICGDGDRLAELQARAAHLPTIVFAGWRRRPEIWALLRLASVGIVPYVRRADFLATIPNKVPEYLSAGLPIALNLDSGRVYDLVRDSDCGFSYHDRPEQLAHELQALRAAPDRLARLRENARTLFDAEFRAEHVYGEMIEMMRDIVSQNARATSAS